jgi:phosphatidylserine/phosphatidylglycerophosphate/cardiolipin synthase-like enzyme/uncharacterized membrane protein YdjX (TVP38/TMEM64 family)
MQLVELPHTGPLLRAGETCECVARTPRVAFIIDGEAYFAAVADALELAKESVWLIGWDFHSGLRLRCGSSPRDDRLSALLQRVVRAQRRLHVRVLAWDYTMIYALEREALASLRMCLRTHPRIQVALDCAHPLGGSQHQKLVVIDDALAFAGGLDLTLARWDTREHLPSDPRRTTHTGVGYSPFHDVQIAVDGEAARALATVARDRWELATGQAVDATSARVDPWPPSLAVSLRDATVGISRTLPGFGDRPEVREVETLYRASVAAARRFIYIENQYLTSARFARWISERLQEPQGPEVVIVVPMKYSGWIEEYTMRVLRDRLIRDLRAADVHGRLRVVYPHIPGLAIGEILNVHSKVMVVDDMFARVGSSNLSNRSLGLDSECDVAVEALDSEQVRRGIAAFRDDLLAEHLGVEPAAVARELARSGSLLGVIDALGKVDQRTLRPVPVAATERIAEAMDALGAIDPEEPIPFEELVAHLDGDWDAAPPARRRVFSIAAACTILLAVAAAWQLTPLRDWITLDGLASLLRFLQGGWQGALLATVIFTVACILFVPVTALTIAAGLALGPGTGIAVAWFGSIAAAALGHVAGRWLWQDSVRRLASARLTALSQRLARNGVLATALCRVLPIAPFTVVNMIAGASGVRARDFVAGTAIGMLPGTVVLVLIADSAKALSATPGGPRWLWIALALLSALGVVAALRRFVFPRVRMRAP